MSNKASPICEKWGNFTELSESYTAVSNYFLKNYYRLVPHEGAKGLSSSEVMVLIHLLSYKWDTRDPYPSLGTICKRMSMTRRSVRKIVKDLEDLGLIQRELRTDNGLTNKYNLDGLFEKLMSLYREDIDRNSDQEL